MEEISDSADPLRPSLRMTGSAKWLTKDTLALSFGVPVLPRQEVL